MSERSRTSPDSFVPTGTLSRIGVALSGREFPARGNSLNMFRLILAALVLFAHSWPLTGRGEGPLIQGENLGTWAVAGFFVVSGFLIMGSRMRTRLGEYLLHRIVRIYPGFFVCLVATAFLFAPLAAVLTGTTDQYFSTAPTPLEFIWANLGLSMTDYNIGKGLSAVPYPNVWNGSLWTLYHEFLCYLMLALLGTWAWFRRSIVAAAVLFILSVALWANSGLVTYYGLDAVFLLFSKLAPFFLGGTLAYFVIDRYGLNRWIGIGSGIVAVALIGFVPGWGGQAASPFLAYAILFLSTIVPQPRWIAKNDVSYGFYIYAWPMQQLLVLLGGARWGFTVFMPTALALTLVFAVASWFLVERPMMRRVRRRASTL